MSKEGSLIAIHGGKSSMSHTIYNKANREDKETRAEQLKRKKKGKKVNQLLVMTHGLDVPEWQLSKVVQQQH